MLNQTPIPIKKTPFDDLTPEHKMVAIALNQKMIAIGFGATFVRVEVGPVVTTYFYKPLPTSPLSKIMSKSEDLALAVGAETILIQRVLNEISIAVPNIPREIISFDSCLYKLASSTDGLQLPILLGQDSRGENISADLATQPHILIAGSTGAGKSVFLSELICSLAVLKHPSELKFILVDTKKLDLTLFSKLAHTIEMVDSVVEFHKVLISLLKEVRTRTDMMMGWARNLGEWNERVGNGFYSNIPGSKMPYIVLVIDELADVILQDQELAKDEDRDTRRTRISKSLIQLAAISRAAGIHIIAATQRPSVEVISGNFKTNFPCRICFKLPSSMDSRVVLDENGAENLLGKGDYLYKTSEDSTIRRAHGAYVGMDTIERILEQHEFIRKSLKGE